MKNRKTTARRWLLLILAAALLGVFLWCENSCLSVTRVSIPADVMEGMRIVHLTDLHGTFFGRNQERLKRVVMEAQPDLIAVTGDFIDKTCDERAAAAMLEALEGIAPIYCVTGNHEYLEMERGRGSYERLIEAIEETEDAYLLRGETVRMTEEITLTGADDIRFAGGLEDYPEYIEGLGKAAEGGFRILLAHRPEMFELYAEAEFDLTLTGHAHGGQIRLPLIGGLYAPGQGLLPEYDSGLYESENGMRMFVGRGLGNSLFPFRVFNRPEITVIEIEGRQ